MTDFPTLNPQTGEKWRKAELLELAINLRDELQTRTIMANQRMQTINTIHAWCFQTIYLFRQFGLEGTPGVSVLDIDHLIRNMHSQDVG